MFSPESGIRLGEGSRHPASAFSFPWLQLQGAAVHTYRHDAFLLPLSPGDNQLVNHFPNQFELCRKDLMVRLRLRPPPPPPFKALVDAFPHFSPLPSPLANGSGLPRRFDVVFHPLFFFFRPFAPFLDGAGQEPEAIPPGG